MRGKKVTVVGFGSEVAIGAKGEAFSGFDQKLLPHLCDLRCSSVLMQREKGFRVLRVASFKFQDFSFLTFDDKTHWLFNIDIFFKIAI